MSERITEYTVRDYSAVDRQINEIANRERVLTQKLQLANYRRMGILFAGGLLALGLFVIMLAIAYSIAFPKKPTIIETVKVVEKAVKPPDIIIQAPAGFVNGNTANQTEETQELGGSEAASVIQDTNKRITDAGADIMASGDVYAALSWDNFNDLDLIVQEPSGNEIWFKKMKSTSNGRLDIDMNAGARKSRSPVERISWPSDAAPEGKYDVKIMYYARDTRESLQGKTNYKLVVSDGKNVKVLTGTIANNAQLRVRKKQYSFEVIK